MGFFGYEFIGKSPEIDATRRSKLDWHANLAQVSQLLFVLAIPFIKFVLAILVNFFWNGNKSDYDVTTNRTSIRKSSQEGNALKPSRTSRDIESILGKEVIKGCGTYEEWIFGLVLAAWLGFLCIKDTAPDSLHLIKRFGLIGASQLPIHYLFALKHPYAPLRLLPKSSRRQIHSLHLVTGRIIIIFVTLHATLYSNIFMQMNIFGKTIQQPKIAVALISVAVFGIMGITSIKIFRRRAYSSFYKIHVVGSTIVLPLLFFHVHYIRAYVLECVAVVGLNALLRMLSN